jgi:SAM-dependent methyltransferase
MKVHDALTRFSDRVQDDVKYRPGHPAEMVEVLQVRCGLDRSSVIADIGSGPGNLARLLPKNGNDVFAVEPNREMRSAGRDLLGHFTGYQSLEGIYFGQLR